MSEAPTKEDLKALVKVLLAAETAERVIENARSAREEELDAEVRAKLAAEFGEALTAARKASNEARMALEHAQGLRALAGVDAPHPPGTRLYEWKRDHYRGWFLTGRVGVVEGVTPATEYSNTLVYGRPSPGDYVLRILKKDGAPGRHVYRFLGDHVSTLYGTWLPEGKKPRKATW